MRIIYCCPIQLGGEISNYTGFLPPLLIPSAKLPNFNTRGATDAEKAPWMYNGYIYSKDDVRSPFVKPP
jgi:hypothetical protein